jgi:hypothetical protein
MTGETLKQQGLALVAEHSADWQMTFAERGRRVAKAGLNFTAEDILLCVGIPPNPNAVGAAMHALARELKLVRVGYRPAKRPSRHAGVVAVWRAP